MSFTWQTRHMPPLIFATLRFFWFECFQIYLRIFFIGAVKLASSKSDRRAAIGLVASLCALVLYREKEPFARQSTNSLAYVCQFVIILTYGCALVIETGLSKNIHPLIFGLSLVAVNLAVLSLVIAMAVHRHAMSYGALQRVLTDEEFEIAVKVRNLSLNGSSNSTFTTNDALEQYLIQAANVQKKELVGKGAFGNVWKGSALGQLVAIKTMSVVNETNVINFKAEILLTATLRHPNIVVFVGACWEPTLFGLLLEWMPNGSLDDLLSDTTKVGRWDDSILLLATDIARGMVYLHGRSYIDDIDGTRRVGVLHRDLKVSCGPSSYITVTWPPSSHSLSLLPLSLPTSSLATFTEVR